MKPIVDPAAQNPSTIFPLDDLTINIEEMSQETIITYSKTAPILHSLGGVEVVRLSRKLVLKSGEGVQASEGETMRYVTKNYAEVRLPKVYHCFSVNCPSPSSGVKGHIVMDYIDGISLNACWDELLHEVRNSIVTQVAAMINHLQTIQSAQPGVFGGGISRGIWFSDYGVGLFANKDVFEKWINWKLNLSKAYQRVPAEIPGIKCHNFVLVHGDLSPRNFILDSNNQVWLIDSGCAGFYPPIFEVATVKHQVQFPSFAQMLLPLIYNDANELVQLESCQFGINRVPFSLPPEIVSPLGPDY